MILLLVQFFLFYNCIYQIKYIKYNYNYFYSLKIVYNDVTIKIILLKTHIKLLL